MKKSILVATLAATTAIISANASEAEKLFDAKCAMCHVKTMPTQAQMGNMLAPALFGVMNHVKMAYPNKQDAVNFMTDYIMSPSKEKAICQPQKIAKFGLMPSMKSMVKDDEAKVIVEWMFDNYPPKGFIGREMFAMFDLDKNGMVTEEEFKKFITKEKAQGIDTSSIPAFAKMDLNADGTLIQQEFTKFAQSRNKKALGGSTATQNMPQRGMMNRPTFEDFDKDGDGMISRDEFNAFRANRMATRAAGMTNTQNRQMPMGRGAANRPTFEMFDLDGNGIVTKSELAEFRQKRQSQKAAQGMPMRNAGNTPAFESMDTNGDGELTKEEFNTFRANRMGQKRAVQ